MEIIHIKPSAGPSDQLKPFTFRPCVLALGVFDGVHKGHQALIAEAQRIARDNGLSCGVMTFDPNPKAFLSPSRENVKALTPLSAKAAILQQMGVDFLIVIQFNRPFSRLSPARFVEQYLLGLNCRHAVVGFDFRYGYQGQGHAQTLAQDAGGKMAVTIVHPVVRDREKISSTAIRRRLLAGDTASIPRYLGRPYEVQGEVGDVLHRTPGHTVFQIVVPEDYLLPRPGDYLVEVEIKDCAYLGRGRVLCGSKSLVQFEPRVERPADDWRKQPVTIRWLRSFSAASPAPGERHEFVEVERYVFESS